MDYGKSVHSDTAAYAYRQSSALHSLIFLKKYSKGNKTY